MKFFYRAIDRMDNVHESTIDAPDFDGVLKQLYERRLFPLEVQQMSSVAMQTEGELQRLKKLKSRLGTSAAPPASKPTLASSLKSSGNPWLPVKIIAKIWSVEFAIVGLALACCLYMWLTSRGPQ